MRIFQGGYQAMGAQKEGLVGLIGACVRKVLLSEGGPGPMVALLLESQGSVIPLNLCDEPVSIGEALSLSEWMARDGFTA